MAAPRTARASEELRRRQLVALINWGDGGRAVSIVVLALEDLHWADPTTLDVLRGIAERGALAPLFVLSTARPEFRAPWGVRSHHTTISLAPLDRQQGATHGWRARGSPRAAATGAGDGVDPNRRVPLFVEEVTRLLLDRREQSDIQARGRVA